MTAPPLFPLRWESTGDQWWYASPIDLAAATGRYDLVRVLLRSDPNLIISLTSLRRLRRLESLWDDHTLFSSAPRRRAAVARRLYADGLLRAGYGGWLLYTAAAAGDVAFVEKILQRDPAMVFGEGEFGVTEILYAAARGGSRSVFGMVYGAATKGGEGVFEGEMRRRAVHAAARGGSWEVVAELLSGGEDVLELRDAKGSTVLHSAAAKGRVEVVQGLIASFDILDSRDNHGNTPLHVAAFRGHLLVVETLINASPPSAYLTNNDGDTFLHVAVAGFRAPGFQWLDRQMELMWHLISGNIVNISNIINLQNNDGRSVLHMAVAENAHPDLVSLLMSVESIDLNLRDADGMTPLDLLRQHPKTVSSEILIKQLISAGGMSSSIDHRARSFIASQIKMQTIWSSPGTSFKLSDSEIFLSAGVKSSGHEVSRNSGGSSSRLSIGESCCISDDSDGKKSSEEKKRRLSVANRLKNLLQWPQMEKKASSSQSQCKDLVDAAPLRQRFSKATSLPTNKRTLSIRSSSMPSPSTRKRFTTSLMHGVIQGMPHLTPLIRTSLQSPSKMPMVSHSSWRQVGICCETGTNGPYVSSTVTDQTTENQTQESGVADSRPANRYFCFRSRDVAADDSSGRHQLSDFLQHSAPPSSRHQLKDYFRHSVPSAA